MKFQWNNLKNRTTALILTVCILLCAAGGMAYAKYVDDITKNENVNIIAKGKLKITVTGEGPTYTITNTDESNMPAYVRFTVVVNKIKDGIWALDHGSYTIDVTGEKGFTQIDDCYYYKGILAKGGSFSFNVTVTSSVTDLQVQVLAEGIQCVPADVAQNAWKCKYDSSGWSKIT